MHTIGYSAKPKPDIDILELDVLLQLTMRYALNKNAN